MSHLSPFCTESRAFRMLCSSFRVAPSLVSLLVHSFKKSLVVSRAELAKLANL